MMYLIDNVKNNSLNQCRIYLMNACFISFIYTIIELIWK